MKPIIPQIHQLIKTKFIPFIPKQRRERFLTGIEAFSLREFDSINANGRLLSKRDATGEMKVYRVVRDSSLGGYILQSILVMLESPVIELALDHSTFGTLKIGCVSIRTGKGRGIPVWLYARLDHSGTRSMRKDLMEFLSEFIEQVKEKEILLTADRWFPSEELVRFCNEANITCIFRIRSNIHVGTPWEKNCKIYEISQNDTPVKYHGMDLRLVESDYHAAMKQEEPWFLLTNNQELSRQKIITAYAHRFEIEEIFKDIKWILNYEWHRIKTPIVLETILKFVFLGWWMMWVCMGEVIRKSRSKSINKHKRRSWFRVCIETLKKAYLRPEDRLVPL